MHHIWFKQDSATSHTAAETLQLLQTKFPGRVILRRGEVNWPPSSTDLTPLDFFICCLKGKGYANNPPTIPETKIRRVIDEIQTQLCHNVIENLADLEPSRLRGVVYYYEKAF